MASTDYKTTIRIEGDASGATSAANQAKNSLGGIEGMAQQVSKAVRGMLAPLTAVRIAIAGVMRAFGVFYLAVEGVQKLVSAFKALSEKLDEIRSRATRLAFAKEVRAAAEETDRLVRSQERLNNQLKQELGLLQKSKSLRDMEEQGEDNFADESTRIQRALALAAETDPNKRQLMQDQFAAEDERRAQERRDKSYTNRISDLDEEESAYSSKAKAAATRIEEVDKQITTQTEIFRRYGTSEKGEEGRKATLERLKTLRETRNALEQEKKTFEEEAAYRRRQMKVLQEEQQRFRTLGGSAAAVSAAKWREQDEQQRRDQEDLDKRLQRRQDQEDWKREYKEAGKKEQQQSTPAEPKKPEPPAEPKKPEPPAEPKKPEPPAEPKKPEPPAEPKKPEPPAEPKKPEPPQEPKKPEQPQEPKKPEPPQEPKKPEQPQEPKKPEPPAEPKKPEPPAEPKKPEPPAEPKKPEPPQQKTQLQMLQERESSARAEMDQLRKRYDAEMAKPIQERDTRLLDELKSGILEAQDRMFDARSERESLAEKEIKSVQQRVEDSAERLVGVAEPGANRLTAMGLGAGSGVTRVQEQMAKSLADLVKLGQQQIAELQGINNSENYATYSD